MDNPLDALRESIERLTTSLEENTRIRREHPVVQGTVWGVEGHEFPHVFIDDENRGIAPCRRCGKFADEVGANGLIFKCEGETSS